MKETKIITLVRLTDEMGCIIKKYITRKRKYDMKKTENRKKNEMLIVFRCIFFSVASSLLSRCSHLLSVAKSNK
jgi:hypothetical protein